MSDEIILEGKEYVSSKRAADLSGYAQDYIGQLARSGQIDVRRVGGLWYISPESIMSYKEKADEYMPISPTQEQKPMNADALVSFDGKDYISSVRASKLTGYNQDYIGQLARSQKVASRQVGNRWYVDRESLLAHKEEKDRLLGAVQTQSVGLANSPSERVAGTEVPSNDDPYFSYLADTSDLLPSLTAKEEVRTSELSDKHVLDLHSAKNHIEIKRAVAPLLVQAQHSSVVLEKSLTTKSISRDKKHASTALHTGVGVLTILIVLSVGFVTLKDRSVYAYVSRSAGGKQAMENISASAVAGFNKAGDLLEEWFVPELRYQRQD